MLFACEHATGHSNNTDNPVVPDNPENPGGGGELTYIRFKNLDLNSVDVYAGASRSGTPLASLAAMSQSEAIQWTSGEHGFYLTYNLNIAGVDVSPYAGTYAYIYKRVDRNKTTEINIEPLISILPAGELETPLSSQAYVKVTNAGAGASLSFTKGSVILKPLNSEYGTLNAGESAVYRIDAGSASLYSFRWNGFNMISFPASLVTFEPGMIYTFVFNGASLSWDGNPVPVSVQTCYEEKAYAEPSAGVPPVSGISAQASSESEIAVSWSAAGSANYLYFVYCSDSEYWEYRFSGVSKDTSFTGRNLAPQTVYYYKARPFLNGAFGEYSTAADARTKLAAPSGLSVQARSLSEIFISWNGIPDASYKLMRASGADGAYSLIASPSETSYTDSGLNANSACYYKVCSVRDGEESNYCAPQFAVTTNLKPPEGLKASAVSSGAISLSWSAAAGAEKYYIYRSESTDGDYEQIGSAAGTSYSDSGLVCGTTYYYKAHSYYQEAYSNFSASASATTTVDAPVNLTAQALSSSEIALTWEAVSGAQYYYIYTAPSASGPWTEKGLAYTSGTSYEHTELSAETTYYYKVKSFANGVYSADSAVVNATPPSAGLFVDNGGLVSGVASPFSIANALAYLKTKAQANTAYTIIINADETLAPQVFSKANLNNKTGVSIKLKGYGSKRTVQLASAGRMFTVGTSSTDNSVTLILDENITLCGLSSNFASLVYSYGTLIMNSGAKITGNNSSSYGGDGGGVYVGGGTFTMSGGEISGNTASIGGGVCVSGCTFTMNGGEISSNIASIGGGVYVYSSGTFTKSGSSAAIIYGSNASPALKENTALGDAYGHAVYTPSAKKRNTTAGATVLLDSTKSGSAGGWE